MLVEINGAGFANKGAQLMLETTVDRLRSRDPSIQFCINAGTDRPYAEVANLGASYIWPSGALYTGRKFWTPQFYKNVVKLLLTRVASPPKLNVYGLVARKQVDAFIDISGYAFGDFWGVNPLHATLSLARHYRKAGKPVILLPQMFGPFENETVKGLFQQLAEQADVIYAREQTSYEQVKQVAPDANLKIAPDITIFSSKKSDSQSDVDPKRVCIVPNIRVTDAGNSPISKDLYLNFLTDCAKQILKAGMNVSIVVHETFGADARLAEGVISKLNDPNVKLFADPNPKVLKNYIANSRFLIGSRFHSLVAALSSGVPAIAFGWAHKYPQLLGDFDVEEFNLQDISTTENVSEMIKKLIDDEGHWETSARIAEARVKLEKSNSSMWQDVFELLEVPGVS
jgi:colanic acid/amylovoran biosynthesis protein